MSARSGGLESHRKYRGKSCFVIMPFGTKTHPYTNETMDFDRVYGEVIVPAVSHLLEEGSYSRSDSATSAGLIHSEMIDDIISSDVSIVDITTANPNVMYELGVRHAAKRSGTVVIKREGDSIPFNIGGIRAFEYPSFDDPKAIESFVELLVAAVDNALDGGQVDSLVHGLHRGLNVTRRARRIRRRETHIYRWPESGDRTPAREICIITGDIADVTDVDVWVNPENTAMQLGRFYDDSVSAAIRYFGARRDPNGFVRDDLISKALKRATAQLPVVQPGTVVPTSAGALRKSNGVRKILHVAAQYGEPSKGYLTVRNAAGCVSNCLRAIDMFNEQRLARMRNTVELDSVLIPLFGVKSVDRIPELVARDLIQAAVLHFEKQPQSLIDRVYFLAYTDADLALCEQAMKWLNMEPFDIEIARAPRARNRKDRIERAQKSGSPGNAI